MALAVCLSLLTSLLVRVQAVLNRCETLILARSMLPCFPCLVLSWTYCLRLTFSGRIFRSLMHHSIPMPWSYIPHTMRHCQCTHWGVVTSSLPREFDGHPLAIRSNSWTVFYPPFQIIAHASLHTHAMVQYPPHHASLPMHPLGRCNIVAAPWIRWPSIGHQVRQLNSVLTTISNHCPCITPYPCHGPISPTPCVTANAPIGALWHCRCSVNLMAIQWPSVPAVEQYFTIELPSH